MSSNFNGDHNPYQTPASAGPAVPPVIQHVGVDVAFVKKFRDQIHALGAFWIIIGAIAVGLSALAFGSEKDLVLNVDSGLMVIWSVIIGLGMVWIALGVLTCLKQMWAVYVALVLSYLSLIGNLLQLAVCAIIMLIAVIAQAHRVINWAGRLRHAGVPLTARPQDFIRQ